MEMWESLVSERESSKCGLGMLCHPSPEERDGGVRWGWGHDVRTRISAVSPRRESDGPRMIGTPRGHRSPQWWAERVMCTLTLTCGPMWQSHTPAQTRSRECQRSSFTAHAQPLLNQIMNQAISFTLKGLLGMVGLVKPRANIATHRCEEAWLSLKRKESENGGTELKKEVVSKKEICDH